MTNNIKSFIQGQCFLIYDQRNGPIPTARKNANLIESIQAIAVNLFHLHELTPQEDGALLRLISHYACLDIPYDVGGVSYNMMNGSVERIRVFIRNKWLASYIASNPTTSEAAKGFIACMERSSSYLYTDHPFFEMGLNSFISFYLNCSPPLQQILATLCKTYPHVFSACYDVNSNGFALFRILEKKDPLHIECLNKIAYQGRCKDKLLRDWILLEKSLHTLPLDSSLKHLNSLYSRNILPKAWIERTLQELINFTDVKLSDTVKYAFLQSSFFDFYFFLKLGYSYDHECHKAQFPLGAGSQPSYSALLHQSVLIAENGLTEENWNFDQVLALMMLRRNYIALALNEDQADQAAVPRRREETCLATACSEPLGEVLRTHLSTPQNWNGFVKKEGDVYQLLATLGTQQFAHSTVILSDQNVLVEHTKDPQVRKEILKGVGQLFEEAKRDTPADLTKKLGLIFWWIVRAKPWLSQELGVAEGVIRSLAKMRDAPLPAWKAGIAPSDEVMKHLDPNEFAEAFDRFFDK